MRGRKFVAIACLITVFGLQAFGQVTERTARPWTYWWWMGSAVNKTEISRQLQLFAESGLGGVHIIPIYGARGYEEQFLDFLSEPWMEMAAFTVAEAEKYNMGVDLSLGTGWPFGGPWVDSSESALRLAVDTVPLVGGATFDAAADKLANELKLETVEAVFVTDGRRQYNLSPYLQPKETTWQVPEGDWRAVVFGIRPTRQQVKRAAPGGEGLVVDYFDREDVEGYLNHFDSVFSHTSHPLTTRAVYHDSYEVYGAQWTEELASIFRKQHGYEPRAKLSLLDDTYHPDRGLFLHDIRATLSDLLYNSFAKGWTNYAKRAGFLTRYQAHGSPGNILDLYALATIPETESFGCADFGIPGLSCDPDFDPETFGRPDVLMTKFASSPAHLYGKPLVSSETGTWLGNHFKVSLRQVKPHVDQLFLGGVNHVFFHGTTYSPQVAAYPGWRFYASTNFGPGSHFHEELPLLNAYIERCQTALQASRPDNDLLLYFPIHDLWSTSDEDILLQLDVHHGEEWFGATPFGRVATQLQDGGYAFDYVSDRQLGELTPAGDEVSAPGGSTYRAVLVPAVTYLPKRTLQTLRSLEREGVRVIYLDRLPSFYPGLGANKKIPSSELKGLTAAADAGSALAEAGIEPEMMKALGIDFLRKTNAAGTLYFLTNLSDSFERGRVALSADHRYVTLTDPLTGTSSYVATPDSFFLELPPGKSMLLQTSMSEPDVPRRPDRFAVDTTVVTGPWIVQFNDTTGLAFQASYTRDTLTSWTEWDEPLAYFSGKATFRTTFSRSEGGSPTAAYRIVFDGVHESAEVILNGKSLGTVWAFPNTLEVPAGILQSENVLEVVVQNLSANYMRQFDRKHPEWKNFYDINFVDITYQPFDAGRWEPTPSGLAGQVRLIRLE